VFYFTSILLPGFASFGLPSSLPIVYLANSLPILFFNLK